MRVLIVDDEHERHEHYARQYDGHVVVHAYNFFDAVDVLSDERFDVVQLDHDLNDYVRDDAGKIVLDGARPRERTGLYVAEYMYLMPDGARPRRVIVHSWNAIGAARIIHILRLAGIDCEYQAYGHGSPVADGLTEHVAYYLARGVP